MTKIYFTDSDEEAGIWVSQKKFQDKARNDCLSSSHNLSVKVRKIWFKPQRTRYGKFTQSKSGQASKEMTERQNWIQDKFNFLRTNIRRKGLCESSGYRSPHRGDSASAASAHNISQGSTGTDNMDTSIRSRYNTPAIYHLSEVSWSSSVNQHLTDQFAKMKAMLRSFLGPRQGTPRTVFCNYLASAVQNLEERDFQTYRNEAVKLLSGIQSSADERNHQQWQPTLSRSYSTTSTYVPPQTYQQKRSSHFQGIHLDYSRNPDASKQQARSYNQLNRPKW